MDTLMGNSYVFHAPIVASGIYLRITSQQKFSYTISYVHSSFFGTFCVGGHGFSNKMCQEHLKYQI